MHHFKPHAKTPRRWRATAPLRSDLLHGWARAPRRPEHSIHCSRCGFGRGVGVSRAGRWYHDLIRRLRCRELAAHPLPDSDWLLTGARRAARMGSAEHSGRQRRDTHRDALEMVVGHRDTSAGYANTQCNTGVCRPNLAMCACTAPSRVLEGATAGQDRPNPGPVHRLAADSPVFGTCMIIYDLDPASAGAQAALRARY